MPVRRLLLSSHVASRMLVALPLVIVVLASFGAPAQAQAQAQERPHKFATLSLWDPVSTNSDREASTNLRIALIQSYVHSVRGLDITGVASQLGGDIKGVQLTGIYSHIEGGGRGAVLSGFASNMGGEFTGLNASLVMSLNRARFSGLQISGLANFTTGGFSGFQWAGTLNMNDGTGKGWQASSLGNVSNGKFVGLQTSMFFNFANVGMSGIQAAGLNWTRHIRGSQIGLLNIAGSVDGIQLGILNFSEQHNGVPVGLVNVASNGTKNWVSWASSYLGVQTGVRTTVNNWYSILSVGGVYMGETDLDVLAFAWNYGYRLGFTERLSLSVDAGFVHIIPDSNPDLNDRLRPAVQGRAALEFALGSSVSLMLGAGGNQEWSEYASGATTDFDPLVFGGISLFGEAVR